MKKQISLIKKSVIVVLLWAMASVTAMAQSKGQIVPVGDPPEYSTCIPTKKLWSGTYPIISYHLQGMENECHRFHWYTRGDLQIDGISPDSLTVYVSSVSTNPVSREKDFAKGRLYVTYWEENISTVCGDPVKYYDIYKTFKDTVTQIVGPDCINEGDTITFSIDAMVSQNINSQIGIDHYYWDWSEGLVDNILYFSGDSSSITFIAGTLTGHDTIFVDMGQCNLVDGFRYTKIIGQAIENPVFVSGKEPAGCMPFNVLSDTIILVPQNNVTYSWNLGSWPVVWTSLLGDTIIFSPATNAQEIVLTGAGTCEEKDFKYQISRSLTSSDTLDISSKCLQSGSSVRFSVAGVPDGTLMEWLVSGTGWYIDPKLVNTTKPYITVGSDTGIIAVKTKDCFYTITDTILIKPEIPVTIFGDSCLAGEDTSDKTYYVTPVAHADFYQWTYPDGWSVVGDDDKASITLQPNGTNGGTVQVRAIGCSESLWRSKAINMIAIIPDTITVSCVSVGTTGTATLSVVSDIPAGSQFYNWQVPSEFGNIVSANADSSVITVNTVGNEGSFAILVRAYNDCGNSDWKSNTVTVESPFWIESVVFGPPTNRIRNIYINTESEDIPWDNLHTVWYLNGSYYTEGDGPEATYIDISYTANGNANALVTNQLTGCQYYLSYSWGSGYAAKRLNADSADLDEIIDIPVSTDIIISPNPAKNKINITLPESSKGSILFFSLDGKLLKREQVNSLNVELNILDIPNGNYIVVVSQNGKQYSKQIVIKK